MGRSLTYAVDLVAERVDLIGVRRIACRAEEQKSRK
jgi:hypothetical protein